MLVKIVARPPRRRPCPGRRPDPGPKNCNASPRYFISRANDFSEHRRRVERPARAARRTLAVTHAIVSNEPPGPCSLPLSSPPLRTPAEGHGSAGEDPAVRLGRPAALGSKGDAWPDSPESILWRDSHRAKGISRRPAFERIRTVAPATDIRAHQPASCLVSRQDSLYLISKCLRLFTLGRFRPGIPDSVRREYPGYAVRLVVSRRSTAQGSQPASTHRPGSRCQQRHPE
jgi:hypothetical protein